MSTPRKPRPVIAAENEPFFTGAASGELVIQRCRSCGARIFFPRVGCPHCLSADLEWIRASGRGQLVSFCIVERPHHPAFYPEVPILFGAIRLEEGPTMLAELRCPTEQPRIGMAVEVAFEEVDEGLTLPVWLPATDPQPGASDD